MRLLNPVLAASMTDDVPLPPHWSPFPGKSDYLEVEVARGSPEFIMAMKMLNTTCEQHGSKYASPRLASHEAATPTHHPRSFQSLLLGPLQLFRRRKKGKHVLWTTHSQIRESGTHSFFTAENRILEPRTVV